MTDHQQAALEAAAKQHSPHLWDGRFRDSLLRLRGFTPEIADEAVEKRRAEILAEAQEYIAAAEPHLRKKWAEEEAAKLAKTTVGLAAILDRFLENAEWESSGEEMAQKIIESVQNGLLEGAGE